MLRKNLWIIGIMFLLCMGAYYLLLYKAPGAKSLQVPSYIQQATSGLWQKYTPDTGRFTIAFPNAPKHASIKENAFSYDVYKSVDSDGTKYEISMTEYPASTDLSKPEAILQNVLKKLALGPPKDTIIGSYEVSVQEHSALDFNLQGFEGATIGRAILAGNTLFVITVKNRDLNNLQRNFQTFTDSFKIL